MNTSRPSPRNSSANVFIVCFICKNSFFIFYGRYLLLFSWDFWRQNTQQLLYFLIYFKTELDINTLRTLSFYNHNIDTGSCNMKLIRKIIVFRCVFSYGNDLNVVSKKIYTTLYTYLHLQNFIIPYFINNKYI